MRTPQLADNLRRAVLQAAIEGKLNDRTSEDARDLLAAIQTEKTALQKTGSLKKAKPLAAIDEEEIPFAIPENWVWVRQQELCWLDNGQKHLGESLPYLEARVIRGSKEPEYKNSGILVEKNVQVILVDGENSGEIMLTPFRGYLGSTFKVLGKTSLIDEKFLMYLFLLNQRTYRENKRGAAIPHLDKDLFKNKLVPLPPLTEQQQIVAKLNQLLTEIDDLKTQEQALLAAQNAFPKKLRAALLQAAVQGELNERTNENARDLLAAIQAEKAALQKAGKLKKDKPLAAISEEEIPFTIPENWVWVRLGDVADISAGATPDTKDLSKEGNIPYFKVSDMNAPENQKYMVKAENFLSANSKYKTIPANSIIYPKNGGALLTNKRRITTAECLIDLNTGYCAPIIVNVDYVYLWFFTVNFGDFYTGTAVPTVNAGTIKNLLIPLPPLTEQQQIVAKLEALLAEIEILENAS